VWSSAYVALESFAKDVDALEAERSRDLLKTNTRHQDTSPRFRDLCLGHKL
jgi:hypothetical protein